MKRIKCLVMAWMLVALYLLATACTTGNIVISVDSHSNHSHTIENINKYKPKGQ